MDESIASVLLSSKHETFSKSVNLNLKNILTLIDRFDRRFLDTKKKVSRDVYEFLCEFVHPNGPGLNLLHGDFSKGEVSLRLTAQRKQMIWERTHFALALLPVVSACLTDLLAHLARSESLSVW